MTFSVETLVLLISTIFGAGWFGQWLLVRYSKSKQERDAGAAKEYLSLAVMSADELERRINLVAKLDEENRKLSNNLYLLQTKQEESEARRRERDEHFEAMEAKIAAMNSQIDQDVRERADMRAKLAEFEVKYRSLWKYLIAQLELMKNHDVKPIPPPDELKNDPELARILQEFDDTRTGNTGKFKTIGK